MNFWPLIHECQTTRRLHVLICPPVECDILVPSCVRFPVNSQSTIQIGGWRREGEIYSDSRHRTKHENRAGFPALGLQESLDTRMREEREGAGQGGRMGGSKACREAGREEHCTNSVPISSLPCTQSQALQHTDPSNGHWTVRLWPSSQSP